MPDTFDDDAARQALRTLTDDPAPPVTTTFDQVLRRGRRRVFAQRAGAVAGVVAVVAAIGAATVLLRPAEEEPGDGGVRVAATTAAKPAGPLPGWTTVPADEGTCRTNPADTVPGTPTTTLLPVERVQPAFTRAVDAVLGVFGKVTEVTWAYHSPRVDGPRGYVAVDVPMDNGFGQLQLEAGVYPGTPAQMADAARYAYGDCRPPARHVLPDGTVLQLFQPDLAKTEQPLQHLQVFRPDGRHYVLTAAGWGDQDMVPASGGGYWIRGGRGKLPVTQEQLAAVATALVSELG